MKNLFKNEGLQSLEVLDERVKAMAVLLDKVRSGALSEEELRNLSAQLCHLQNEKGAWIITDMSEMPGDIRFEFFYIPAMYATAILIETMPLHTSSESLCLSKALALLEGRQMEGHGYEAINGYLRGVSILHESVKKADQEVLRTLCPRFVRMWGVIRHNLRTIQSSETSWWISEEDRKMAAKLLREVKMDAIHGDPSRRLYFAYGSNMCQEQMRDRCKGARLIGPAWIENHRLNFRQSCSGYYATLDSAPGEKAEGLLWLISQSDEDRLDRYEGVHHSDCYRKELVIVQTKEGAQKALIYVLSEDRPQGMPSKSYVDVVRSAYVRHSFDLSKLEETVDRLNDDGTM